MSSKWTGTQNESGILRKSDFKEKKEELFVFGYSCKLFRDDDRALYIDQGKHLIPWMGDETLKIDRYDARGALHELSRLEAPSGGFDWRVELTRTELDVEQLCDEERYRALHTDEDEEEMYKEEELKRLHKAGYGQVGFNYDAPQESLVPAEVDEPFVPQPSFKELFTDDIVFPESLKQNAIVEKTAKFVATQGTQMEILIKAKQGDNSQFKFMNKDDTLHAYYTSLIQLVKTGKWPEKEPAVVEEKPEEHEEYLHPSLASTIVELAPAVPALHYAPAPDCDYALLVHKLRGSPGRDGAPPGELPPPGTAPLPPRRAPDVSRPPVLYNTVTPEPSPQTIYQQQYAAYYQQYMNSVVPPPLNPPQPVLPQPEAKVVPNTAVVKPSTGLSLVTNYNSDDSEVSDTDDSTSSDEIQVPPEEIRLVIDKMAGYVARNGDEFAEIVRAKNDPRFTFLEPADVYHAFYLRLMAEKRGVANGKESKKSKVKAPVSFSIKKLKEPDPILPKPALPYESSSEDESEKTEKERQEKVEEPKEAPKPVAQAMPPILVYKMEGATGNLPTVKTIEPLRHMISKTIPTPIVEVAKIEEVIETKKEVFIEKPPVLNTEMISIEHNEESKERIKVVRDKKEVPEEKKEDRVKVKPAENAEYHKEKKRHKEKKEYRSKSENRESRRSEKKKDRDRDNGREKKKKKHREEMEAEIISLEDNSDDLIDLTGDQSDTKGDAEEEKVKQQERRRRAAEFLKLVGVDPVAASALPNSSLACAMVDTLETIRKKKVEEEEKRRRREKRRHRYDYGDEDKSYRKSRRRRYRSSDENDEADYDSSKRKKRKKEKKHTKTNKRRRQSENEQEPNPINIDIASTLKELRTKSPTKELELEQERNEIAVIPLKQDSTSDDDEEKQRKKKKEREYSEGEWSSDSEGDSGSSATVDED